jgi:hypothetical protein
MENTEIPQIVAYLAPKDAKLLMETHFANNNSLITTYQAQLILHVGHTTFEKIWKEKLILPYTNNPSGKLGKGVKLLFERKEIEAYIRSTKAKVK